MRKILAAQHGFSVIEVILVILILAISVPPLLSLFGQNLTSSVEAEIYTKAIYYAEERMEEILADKRAVSDGRGYGYVMSDGRYDADSPETGFARSVSIDTVATTFDGVDYARVRVIVSHPSIASNVVLGTWITKYE